MKFKIAAISLTSTPNRVENIKQAEKSVREAAAEGASWVSLPEMIAYLGDYQNIWNEADEERGRLYQHFSSLAKELKIVLFAGTWGERPLSSEHLLNQKVFNTLHVFGRNGELLGKYRKVHLFSLKDENGGFIHSEPDGYLPGKSFESIVIDGLRVHLAICYDLRFPEMFATLQKLGPADILMAPSAFTKATGERHWELLCRSRAIDLQAWVVAPNQVGVHHGIKESFGHSYIIDPWGTILTDSGKQPGIVYAEINTDHLHTFRMRLPVLANKRPDLYK